MAKSTKQREVIVSSLEETIKTEDIETSVQENKTFAINPPSLEDSPLLNQERKYVEHSAPIGAVKDNSSIGSSGDSFVYNDQSLPGPEPSGIKLEPNNPNFFNSNPTVDPNFFNSVDPVPHKGVTKDMLQLPGEAANEASGHLADFIIDAYQRFVPEGGYSFTKLNSKEIKKLEDSGQLQFGAYQEVVNHNKEIKSKLEERAKEDTKYLKKHLKNVLQVRGITASPETLLAGAILMVVVGQAILLYSLREEREILMNNLMAKVNNSHSTSEKPKDEVQFAEVETV